MTTTQTPLTRQQIEQLTQEYRQLKDWTTVRDFCAQVYGPGRAVKVEIETNGEYNDEGGTDYSVCSFTAYDASGEELAFDLSQPFWTQPYFADKQKAWGNSAPVVEGEAEGNEEGEESDEEENDGEEDEDEEFDDVQDSALDVLKDYYPWRDTDKALIAQHGWVQWSDLPCDEHNGGDETYNLLEVPQISFPVVVPAS